MIVVSKGQGVTVLLRQTADRAVTIVFVWSCVYLLSLQSSCASFSPNRISPAAASSSKGRSCVAAMQCAQSTYAWGFHSWGQHRPVYFSVFSRPLYTKNVL